MDPSELRRERKPERQEVEQWDLFEDRPRETNSGSTAETKYIRTGIKIVKIFTRIIIFSVVLCSAVVSKGTLLFMTSQVKNNITRLYCNKHIDENKQFMVILPDEERVVWLWLIIFTFMVPEICTFLRSAIFICFRKWKLPTFWEFLFPFITESLATIGSALFVFVVLPELDAIKGAMLTNAVCFVPGLLVLLSRSTYTARKRIKMTLDIVAIGAQASAFLLWPLVDGRPVLYFIPLSLILMSLGWWGNFVSEKSQIPFIRKLARNQKSVRHKKYYSTYLILAPWKCLLFFITTVVVITLKEGNPKFLFDRFLYGFKSHDIRITKVDSIGAVSNNDFVGSVADGYDTITETSLLTPLSIWLINISATYICCAFGKFACKIMIPKFSFAFPVSLSVPALLTGLLIICGQYNQDECAFSDIIPPYLFFTTPPLTYLHELISHQYSWVWLIWLLSQVWITIHIWRSDYERLASTERLFFKPMYHAYLIDQSLALNRRRTGYNVTNLVTDVLEQSEINDGEITRIYACGTMWHETKEEMIEFLKSILRMDEDQCARRILRNDFMFKDYNYYEFETHVLFDDAYETQSWEDEDPRVNQHVLDLIESMNIAASEVHKAGVEVTPPIKYRTPYGGRLVWTLPGQTRMMVHLKDKKKIRTRKRWSQIMIMYYLLGHRIMENDALTPEKIQTISENTYLLALDGDVDFQPQAVQLLVELMKRNKTIGSVCGRLHPVGSSVSAWYQKFEYAISHWLWKTTENVFGSVLCCPGCFSLFRARALMDDNVMARYKTVSETASHSIQYDQGEDRWLTTLVLQRGYHVEYCTVSDAYTHCPEGFGEFYNQRRRWLPSNIANLIDNLTNYRQIVAINDNISRPYILYHVVLLIITAVGPGIIFFTLIVSSEATFKLDHWSSLAWNMAPILFFVFICVICKSDTQLFVAGIMSGLYGLLMMALLIDMAIQIQNYSWLSPSALVFICIILELIVTALLHPQEVGYLKYIIIYYVAAPSVYVLLVIYAVFNMSTISWGTREVPKLQTQNKATKEENQHRNDPVTKDSEGSFEVSCGNAFRMTCCTNPPTGENPDMVEHFEDDNNSFNHWELINNENARLDEKEEKFWKTLIEKYLQPPKIHKKDKMKKEKDLKDFRDKIAVVFFMINSFFVLILFVLTLHEVHINWPLDPKISVTYYINQKEIYVEITYRRLVPVDIMFLILCAVMTVQFLAMLYHRFSVYTYFMANSARGLDLDESGGQIGTKHLIKLIKKLMKPQEYNELEIPVTHRNKISTLAQNKQRTKRVTVDLEQTFRNCMEKISNGTDQDVDEDLRKMAMLVETYKQTVSKKRSQTPQFDNIPSHLSNIGNNDSNERMFFKNLGYEEESIS